jgi:hypothetical protein
MVEDIQGGWVCENDNDSFAAALVDLLKNIKQLKRTSDNLKNRISECNNDDSVVTFRRIVAG